MAGARKTRSQKSAASSGGVGSEIAGERVRAIEGDRVVARSREAPRSSHHRIDDVGALVRLNGRARPHDGDVARKRHQIRAA